MLPAITCALRLAEPCNLHLSKTAWLRFRTGFGKCRRLLSRQRTLYESYFPGFVGWKPLGSWDIQGSTLSGTCGGLIDNSGMQVGLSPRGDAFGSGTAKLHQCQGG